MAQDMGGMWPGAQPALELGQNVGAVVRCPWTSWYLGCDEGLAAELSGLQTGWGWTLVETRVDIGSVLLCGTDVAGSELIVEVRAMEAADARVWRALCAESPQDSRALERFWDAHTVPVKTATMGSPEPARESTLGRRQAAYQAARDGVAPRAQERDDTARDMR